MFVSSGLIAPLLAAAAVNLHQAYNQQRTIRSFAREQY